MYGDDLQIGTFVLETPTGPAVGTGDLVTGVLGEFGARLRVEGEEHVLRADLLAGRLEYVVRAEPDEPPVRVASWPIDATDEVWLRGTVEAFDAAVRTAVELRVRPLVLGAQIDGLGLVDEDVLARHAPLWVPLDAACSACGSADVARIVYGLVDVESYLAWPDRDEVVLGGCCVSPEDRRCRACGTSFATGS